MLVKNNIKKTFSETAILDLFSNVADKPDKSSKNEVVTFIPLPFL